MGFMTAAAIIGIGSMGFGLYNQMEGMDEAEAGRARQEAGARQQAEAARMQAQISKEQAASSVDFAGRERTLNQLASQQSLDFSTSARGINNQIVAHEQGLEGQRRQAMETEGRRKQLEVIRNQQRYRAIALTNATAQGAGRGSGLQGGYGQIAGQSGVNMLGIQQNLQIGRNMFDLNALITGQKQQYADLQYNYAVQQAGNQTTKSNLMYDYAVSNAAFQTRQADAGTVMSQGQGMINSGAGMVSAGQSQQSFGQTLFNAGPQIFSMGANMSNVVPTMFGGGGANQNFSWSNYTNPYYGPGY
jgi:hypothetical protein